MTHCDRVGIAAKSSVSMWIIISMHNCVGRGGGLDCAHMCRIPAWHPWVPSWPTPASCCRLTHSLSANPNHFPPPRHPDPDWTWCTPGIDLAWLGLAALTWFGPKLLAWPRHPAPRPPSAPTGGGGGLPFLLPILHLLPPPSMQTRALPRASHSMPPRRGPWAGAPREGSMPWTMCQIFCSLREREKKEKYSLRTWQPMPLVPHPRLRAPHLNAEQLHNI